MRNSAFHPSWPTTPPSWQEPRFDAGDVTPDPISKALADYMAIEREIAEARMAMARDVAAIFNNATCPVRAERG